MLGKIYFENTTMRYKFVSEFETEDQIWPLIKTDIEMRSNGKFKPDYIRSWAKEPNHIIYDVGSHTEFYHVFFNKTKE